MITAHRLGAIELIELGRSQKEMSGRMPILRQPFLGLRYPMISNRIQLGALDFLVDIGSFLAGTFELLFQGLAKLVDLPLGILSSGTGVLFDGLAGLLVNVPVLGIFASGILLLTKAVIQWGLSVPGLLLGGLGSLFGEIKGAIDATRSSDEKASDESKATERILDAAQKKGGAELKNAVRDALMGKNPSDMTNIPSKNTDLPEGADEVGTGGKSALEKVLEVGLPVAGAATLVFLAIS